MTAIKMSVTNDLAFHNPKPKPGKRAPKESIGRAAAFVKWITENYVHTSTHSFYLIKQMRNIKTKHYKLSELADIYDNL